MKLIPNLSTEKGVFSTLYTIAICIQAWSQNLKDIYIKILKLDYWILLNSNFDVLENELALDL